jgi:hypothetical protein
LILGLKYQRGKGSRNIGAELVVLRKLSVKRLFLDMFRPLQLKKAQNNGMFECFLVIPTIAAVWPASSHLFVFGGYGF